MTDDKIIKIAYAAGLERVVYVHKDGTRMIEMPRLDLLKRFADLVQQAEQVQEPVAWMYKAEPWFDGDSWHETYETTTDKTLAYFKDKNARALCFVEK